MPHRHELFAQVGNVDPHHIGSLERIVAPHLGQQALGGRNQPWMCHEILHELKLSIGKMLLPRRTRKRAGSAIETNVADREGGRVNRSRAARHGANAREQLFCRKGFGEVIVGAGVEALDFIRHFTFCRQHNDRQPNPALTRLAQHLDTIHTGHHDVENRGIECLVPKMIKSSQAIMHCIDLIAAMPQNRRKGTRELEFILRQ